MKNKRIYLIAAAIVFLVLVAVAYWYFFYKPKATQQEMETGTRTAGGGLNNAGNIRTSSVAYNGEIDNGGAAFKWFKDMPHGIRAILKIYQYYNSYLGKKSLLDMTNTYAPAADKNNPTAYAQTLADALGIGINDDISGWIHDKTSPNLPILVTAITKVEQGAGFKLNPSDVSAGIALL